MRALFSLVILAWLGGCAIPGTYTVFRPSDIEAPPAPETNEGAVIIGLSVENPSLNKPGEPYSVSGAWIPVSPSGEHVGRDSHVSFLIRGGPSHGGAFGGTQYFSYQLPAGTYALGWVEHAGNVFPASQFQNLTVMATSRSVGVSRYYGAVRIRPSTPLFVAKPGEVVYVGNLVLDFGGASAQVHWSTARSDSNARASLAAGVVQQMTVRQMQRADGKPFAATDGTDGVDEAAVLHLQ
jgi:hypothetical protein